MRTLFELEKLYKEDTDNSFIDLEFAFNEIAGGYEWNTLEILRYIEWLENRLMPFIKPATSELDHAFIDLEKAKNDFFNSIAIIVKDYDENHKLPKNE